MTNQKSYKQRTYLDPIHGPIRLNLNDSTDSLLANIIDTKEFQRLRRIRQMGLGCFTFHGAEHTRFGHSLGTLFIAKKMIAHLANSFPEINSAKNKLLVSALIHDIGHGPFSHTSEKLINQSHEFWTKKIILGNSEINSLLKSYESTLPDEVTKLLEHNAEALYQSQIISSYVDCDRLDYLHRDSYYVGVPYGLTGSDRIIFSLDIDSESKKLVIKESSGLDAVIHYLQARYSMYQQVYQHKKNLACDFLLKKIIERAKETKPNNAPKAFSNWLNYDTTKDTEIDSYLQIDDFLLLSYIYNFSCDTTCDKVLSDLSSRFFLRKLFKSLEFRKEVTQNKISEILENITLIARNKGLDNNYYFGLEQSASKPYEPYQSAGYKNGKAIFIKQQNGVIKELSQVSGLVKALSLENIVKTCLIFAPELEDEIINIAGFEELFK